MKAIKQHYQFEVSIKIKARTKAEALRKLHLRLSLLGPNRLNSQRAVFQYLNNGVA